MKRRPLYETPENLHAEKVLSKKLSDIWCCEVHKMPKTSPVDLFVGANGKAWGFVEVKIRSNERDKYPTYMISKKKIDAAKKIFDATGLRTNLVVCWKDKTGYVSLNESYPERRGGRYDRNDSADVETVVDIDIALFKELL